MPNNDKASDRDVPSYWKEALKDLYGGSIRLFDHVNKKNRILFSHIDCSTEDVEEYIQENTKAIFIETPTNPMMNVVDIRKISKIAKLHGILLIVDNTFMSPYFQKPFELGAVQNFWVGIMIHLQGLL